VTENNRRAKYYRITRKGRAQLDADARDWERRAAAVARLMEA
jgi:DNA-binding PadR family transcriptional regulator